MPWPLLVLIGYAALTLILVLALIASLGKTKGRRRMWLTFGLLLLTATLGAALLFEAVLLLGIFDDQVNWLIQDVLHLGSAADVGEKPEVVAWVRWLFLAVVAVLLALARWSGHAAWADVVALTAILLLGYAVWDARSDTAKLLREKEPVVAHPPTGRAWLKFGADRLADPLSDYKAWETVTIVLVIRRQNEENRIVARRTARYIVQLRSALTPKGNTDPVVIGLARGERDAKLTRLVRDLASAHRIQVFPAVKGRSPSRPPLAVALAMAVRGGRGLFRLDGRRSRDPDGRITAYAWRVDDRPVGSRPLIARMFPLRAKPYRISLTVTDDDALTASDRLSLIRLPTSVLFCSGCHELSLAGQLVLDRLKPVARRAKFMRIDGHTDSIGSTAYNDWLSRERACEVRAALLSAERARRRIEVRALGERFPAASNQTAGGRSKNRRVEILLDGAVGFLTASEDTRGMVPC